MIHNITVESGKSIRLPTSGKYCDRDIIVTATGGGSATAYTVSSVDELPSNAVDGSTAIVPSDSLVGEWEWKDNQSPLDLSMLNIPIGSDYRVDILGEDDVVSYFTQLVFIHNGDDVFINFDSATGTPLYCNGSFDDSYKRFDLFTDVRHIACLLGPTPFSIDDFKAFIKTNCNRLSGGYSLYTRENGEWVYKCEVT